MTSIIFINKSWFHDLFSPTTELRISQKLLNGTWPGLAQIYSPLFNSCPSVTEVTVNCGFICPARQSNPSFLLLLDGVCRLPVTLGCELQGNQLLKPQGTHTKWHRLCSCCGGISRSEAKHPFNAFFCTQSVKSQAGNLVHKSSNLQLSLSESSLPHVCFQILSRAG